MPKYFLFLTGVDGWSKKRPKTPLRNIKMVPWGGGGGRSYGSANSHRSMSKGVMPVLFMTDDRAVTIQTENVSSMHF